ncbi:MAG TPA: P-II family nitrogen regulator [Methanosarcina sp.]|jgi:nitrogen regulatory protein PII|uniref:Transcriptional regulator n=1 Tax=Methanosarcina spelaei TaxID=1036679 RepID=A0A2A2HS40_9EURY|nr:P-II family nitrogen regulator [Methanosarcina spelaei]PAV12267.1 transcriptional regulator [Methanosarcina spelaei]HII92100.1 P-II family nitrogen regulator [Methanosarcina sp.]
MCNERDFVLIVTIVKKGWGDEVIKASRKAGAQGGTILFGRGTGIHENKSILGLMIEPEKEIVLTIVDSSIEDDIRNSIIKAINLNEPGMGIGFVVSLDKVFGICHPFYEIKCPEE